LFDIEKQKMFMSAVHCRYI